MNNGKQFLDIVCNRLRDKSRLLHDSNIVSEINNMRWNEIKQACAADSGAPAEQSGEAPRQQRKGEMTACVECQYLNVISGKCRYCRVTSPVA
jgi:hypothetical protein